MKTGWGILNERMDGSRDPGADLGSEGTMLDGPSFFFALVYQDKEDQSR
jgi:hypothetical protein